MNEVFFYDLSGHAGYISDYVRYTKTQLLYMKFFFTAVARAILGLHTTKYLKYDELSYQVRVQNDLITEGMIDSTLLHMGFLVEDNNYRDELLNFVTNSFSSNITSQLIGIEKETKMANISLLKEECQKLLDYYRYLDA